MFDSYQRSGMGTDKFHLIDYILEELRSMSGIEYLHNGLLEQVHKASKKCFRHSSMRTKTEMNESLGRGIDDFHYGKLQ